MLWPVSMYSDSTLADQRALISTSVPPPIVQPWPVRELMVAVVAVGIGVKPSVECTQAAPPVKYSKAGPVVVPTRLIVDHGQLDLGDRIVLLTAHPVAHSDCDLSVFDPSSATLLAADLLFVERVPSLDGRLKGWQSALTALKTVAASRAVPGHGPVSVNWPSGAQDLDRYLDVLLRETRAAVKGGMEISDAVASVGMSERGKWKLFDDYQGHNVTQAFKEVEWE